MNVMLWAAVLSFNSVQMDSLPPDVQTIRTCQGLAILVSEKLIKDNKAQAKLANRPEPLMTNTEYAALIKREEAKCLANSKYRPASLSK